MMSSKLILIGAGGFGREVLSWAHDANKSGLFDKVEYYLDDNQDINLNESYGCNYLGSIANYEVQASDKFLLGIASPLIKRKIYEKFVNYIDQFQTLIHPSVVIAKTATIGRGVILCPFSLISADVQIADFVTINALSSVGHDSAIGKFSTLSGHVDITGQVIVGEDVFFGTGARVVPRINVGPKSKIGAGCTLMHSVKENTTYFTQPAKKLF
jgi:sugar O-acyltransferase (sialic acid O-acetyltransferase NeuD family)